MPIKLLDRLRRLKKMDSFIRKSCTGNAKEFSEIIGISISQLKCDIIQMRSLGADICYSRKARSYCYKKEGEFLVGFKESFTERREG